MTRAGAVEATVAEGGRSRTLPVVLTLGRRYLEQPVVDSGRGAFQALPVAWDPARGEWFDVISGEQRLEGEYGHWTGRGMNANSQCIECHATAYSKGYDTKSAGWASRWQEASVGCEACHGPASAHVADTAAPYGPFSEGRPLASYRPAPPAVRTVASPGPEPAAATQTRTVQANPPASANAMSAVCATCHSVRRAITGSFRPGDELLDHYEPSLVDEALYTAGGGVAEEAYEWASFAQSRMHAAGVNCLGCHDVHSGNLLADGDALCLSCHQPSLAGPGHTRHRVDSAGSACVACHMPAKTFMGRDRRRDHALSIPDPVLAEELSEPSACEGCHADLGRERLAAEAGRLWPALESDRMVRRRRLAVAFAAARLGRPEDADVLKECLASAAAADDPLCPSAVMRAASARLLLRSSSDAPTIAKLATALSDEAPLVRSAAAYALGDARELDASARRALLEAAADPIRAVRVNAAWALRGIDLREVGEGEAATVARAFEEWRSAMMLAAEAPESWHTLGAFETARGNSTAAEAAYRRAIGLEPGSTLSRYNLALLLFDGGRREEAAGELEALLASDDGFAPASFALGRIHAERGDWSEAARLLGRCVKLDPTYPRALAELTHAYLEAGLANVARAVLTGAAEDPALRVEALRALLVVALRAGTRDEAVLAARTLAAADAEAASDPEIAALAAGRIGSEHAGEGPGGREKSAGPEATPAVAAEP